MASMLISLVLAGGIFAAADPQAKTQRQPDASTQSLPLGPIESWTVVKSTCPLRSTDFSHFNSPNLPDSYKSLPGNWASTPSLDFSIATALAERISTNNPAQSPSTTSSIPSPDDEGMKCDIISLYEGPDTRLGYEDWVTTPPDDLSDAAENDETASYSLIVRHRRSPDNTKRLLVIDSIVVQSPLLKYALGSVLRRYPGITTDLKRLVFKAPFQPFIHRWDQLINATETESDPQTKQHLQLLLQTLHGEIKDTLDAKKDLVSHNVITYELLWTIFRPGETIFSRENEKEAACILTSADYHQDGFYIGCENVDWSGSNFGRDKLFKHIYPFAGTQQIFDLSAYPLIYHPERDAIEEKLIARGRKFETLHGYHFMSYDGVAIGNPTRARSSRHFQVKGRIIIDTESYNSFSNDYSSPLLPLFEEVAMPQDFRRNSNSFVYDSWDIPQYDGLSMHQYDYDRYHPRHYHPKVEEEAKNIPLRPLTEEQLLLTSPQVKGYSLKDKRWAHFFVDCVGEVDWSENAFDSLVLPEGHKELILAFAEGQLQYKDTFDDVIQGKGKGIIMLLAGPPGVGKTLTAESVAENMRVPLYAMSAGDLGLDPDTVESRLSTILEMVTKWKAILLLDEADVFLEQRSTHDLERNKLVSIFLRVLEYYEGILFLTTNRVQTFDAAFHSRIHVTLNYPDLSTASRRQIWSSFLELSHQIEGFTESDLNGLAELQMNGRQIKNIIKTATLIALKRNTSLKMEHIDIVLGVMENNFEAAAPLEQSPEEMLGEVWMNGEWIA